MRDRDGHRKEASLRGHQDVAEAGVCQVQDWPQDGSTDADGDGDVGNIIR